MVLVSDTCRGSCWEGASDDGALSQRPFHATLGEPTTGSVQPINLPRRNTMQPRGSRAVLTLSLAFGFILASAPLTLANGHRHHGPGCGHEKTVIRVGALVDQTGASTSPLFRSAVELAVAQMNEALEKRHSRLSFELVLGDTKSTPALAQSEALRL